MTTAENSAQESRSIWSRVTGAVGDAYDSLTTTAGDAYDGVKSRTPTTEQIRSGISDQTTKVGDAYGQAKSTVGLRDYAPIAQTLKEWLPELAKDGGLAKRLPAENRAAVSWLDELSEEDMDSFVRSLYAFCSSFNFDLDWLSDPETKNIIDEQLAKTIGEVIRLYGLAHWKAEEMQGGIKVFENLQKWLDRPFARRYREFNQQLFTKLVAEELVAAPPIELFLAPESERETYTRDAISDLIARDNQRFYTILKTQVELAAAELEPEAVQEGKEPSAEAEDAA
jgi:hypothetical protein